VTQPIHGVGQVPAAGAAARAGARTTGASGFDGLLTQRLEAGAPLKFSGHALERVQRRGINLDPPALARLRNGVDRAAAKGGRESLVLVDGTAFVVSVANRTVITAVDREHMREQVFTNIDSAVIA